MTTHKAIIQLEASGPLSVTHLGPHALNDHQILVKVEAVALNPGEQKMIDLGLRSTYPYVPGADLCGTVVEIGSAVKQFNIGDRIISLQMTPDTERSGALQDFVVAEADLSAKVPDHYTPIEACTLPVVLLTNFAAFYTMRWRFPFESHEKLDEPILVWGGGSGVGQAAISLLKLSGYTSIITTAAIKREKYLKSLGASFVVDYKDEECLDKINHFLADRPLMKAIDTISSAESSSSVMQLVAPGGQVAYVLPVPDLAKRSEVQSEAVFCGMFHDNSKSNAELRKFGAEKIWPMIQRILASKDYPLQPQLVLEGNSDDILERVTKGFDIVRKASADGKKVVIPWQK
ncbi:hypothetical protein H2200_005477 [Cladophialophora chaetospira]|uniref:Enoyl reductase (ER) domain-containing protein n=1 Tax=Cladophialophora chaetospira TaxID=386627 RepID=A0AA38XC33_9EURO|nr:hypothetical protein H2200_005477 [Cladophialophora chaetospira]